MRHDEVAVSAFFPALAPGAGVAFEEIARRHGDYALVGAAALVEGDSVKVGYLSVSDVPTVVDLSGVADDDLGDAALEHLEPGERHPRDRGVPCAARARADQACRARALGRERGDGGASYGPAVRERQGVRHRPCPPAGCSPTRSATTSG